jgi:hypothetical protein
MPKADIILKALLDYQKRLLKDYVRGTIEPSSLQPWEAEILFSSPDFHFDRFMRYELSSRPLCAQGGVGTAS